MPLFISLTEGSSPGEQIADQIRGLIATGQLHAGERLPSVRQLANDLHIAPGTVARAYRALETEGMVTAKLGAGTRVAQQATAVPRSVVETARALATSGKKADLTLEEVTRTLGAVWER